MLIFHVLFLACNKLSYFEGELPGMCLSKQCSNSVADVLETNISGVTKTDRNCMSAKAAKNFRETGPVLFHSIKRVSTLFLS